MLKKNYILFTFFCFITLLAEAQHTIITQRGVEFSVRITIVDENDTKIVEGVEIYVGSKRFTRPDISGRFIIKAKVDDEIQVKHPDFETVFHRLTSSEDIKIRVEDYVLQTKKKLNYLSKSKRTDSFLKHIDSARFYKKKDIEKSLSFIEKALENNETKKRKAATYKLLADIYFHWKQYDLATYNYKLSYQIKKDIDVKIGLGKSQLLQKQYEESKNTFEELTSTALTPTQKIAVFGNLGDAYFGLNELDKAILNSQKALAVAKNEKLASKIVDVNTKIADIYVAKGETDKAEVSLLNSLNLKDSVNSLGLNFELNLEEKVADFYNTNLRFDDEIDLRKKSLEKAKNRKTNSVGTELSTDSITSQKINYKIGNAYLLKEDYNKAIPFLEKSKEDAKNKNDIVIEKDATRKISEAFANLGNEEKALENYREYVALVDSLYVRKEQEIQQVKRFSKKIADNQNRIASLEKDKELTQSKISLAYIDQKLSEESNRKQRILIYSLFGGLFLISLLAYFMYRNNKQQKLANNLLALKSMRSQMNPHFIFNALNSVNSFIAVNDERNANRYLSEFSALMRSVLENSDEDFIPLTKEIELLELYVKLEHNRFKNKFDYTISVDESISLEQFSIPPMLLQPYIENAIWHGLRYKKEKGDLTISINKKDDETVNISIIDDGIGRKKSQEIKTKNQLKQKSKGMSTIKNRIAILNDMYKERIVVNVSDVFENGEGTKVELLLKRD